MIIFYYQGEYKKLFLYNEKIVAKRLTKICIIGTKFPWSVTDQIEKQESPQKYSFISIELGCSYTVFSSNDINE